MSREVIISVLVSLFLHGGVAGSGFLFKKGAESAAPEEAAPTIALDLPPPPEPEEPEVVETDTTAETPTEVADLAPPMQNDVPSAVIDSPFVQQLQAAPPPGLNRPAASVVIPTSTRPAVSAGPKMANLFDLADLDQKPQPRLRPSAVPPFELRRAGIKGAVVVGFIIDTTGNVRDPYVVKSSNPGFNQSALDAALKYKFTPGKKGGVAVNTRAHQEIEF